MRPPLASIIKETVKRGGTVIVPAFAVERTQKFLFMLKELMETGQIPRLPVYSDSPMAIKAVEIFLSYTNEYGQDARNLIRQSGSPLEWSGFTFASTPEESKKINANYSPSIIISCTGMATGGRILHHLAQRMPDAKDTILFIGFQAPGTRSHAIKNGALIEDIRSTDTCPGRCSGARRVQRSRRIGQNVGLAAHVQEQA